MPVFNFPEPKARGPNFLAVGQSALSRSFSCCTWNREGGLLSTICPGGSGREAEKLERDSTGRGGGRKEKKQCCV